MSRNHAKAIINSDPRLPRRMVLSLARIEKPCGIAPEMATWIIHRFIAESIGNLDVSGRIGLGAD